MAGHHGSQCTPSVLLLPPCPLRCPRHWTLSLSSVRTWEADDTYILGQGYVSIGPALAMRKHGFPDKNLDNHIITSQDWDTLLYPPRPESCTQCCRRKSWKGLQSLESPSHHPTARKEARRGRGQPKVQLVGQGTGGSRRSSVSRPVNCM